MLEERWTGRALDLTTILSVPRDVGDPSLHSVVRRIGAGKDHSFAITYAGAVFTWGRGDSGQLGHGTYMDVARPAHVMALSSGGDSDAGVYVVDADGGSDFSLFLGSAGVAFICGRDPSTVRATDSVAPSNSADDAMALFPQVIALSMSAMSAGGGALDSTATVVGVSCGESHFALHLSTGSVLLSDGGVSVQTSTTVDSNASDRDADDPRDGNRSAQRHSRRLERVESLRSVKRVVSGGSHTLALC